MAKQKLRLLDVEEAKYKFTPKKGITLENIADILSAMDLTMIDRLYIHLSDSTKEHFTKIPEGKIYDQHIF